MALRKLDLPLLSSLTSAQIVELHVNVSEVPVVLDSRPDDLHVRLPIRGIVQQLIQYATLISSNS